MKEDSKTNPQNKKSMNLTLILRRNRRLNREYFSENIKSEITKNKNEITKIKILKKSKAIIDHINRSTQGYQNS